MDEDVGNFDDLVGQIKIIDLTNLFYNPSEWKINEIFNLETPKKSFS